MKHVFTGILLFVFLLTGFIACIKHNSTAGTSGGTLILSASNLKRGAPLIAAVNGSSSSAIRWTVTPSDLEHITIGNGQAQILFPRPGSYLVKAVYASGADSAMDSVSSMVHVDDSLYTPPQTGTLDTTSLAGVQITITPQLDSSSKLMLLVQSTNVFDCFPTFIYVDTAGGQSGSIGIGLPEIISGSMSGSCNGAKNPAAAYLFPGEALQAPLVNGVYPISVTLNNTTYRGTYTVTDNAYTFNWSYASGVTISPTTVNRL